MSKYEAVYFVGDSSKTRNRGAFSGSLAALVKSVKNIMQVRQEGRSGQEFMNTNSQ